MTNYSGVIKAYDELMETVARQQAELEQQARIDPLTGLGNRLKLAECLDAALDRAKRYGERATSSSLTLMTSSPLTIRSGMPPGILFSRSPPDVF